MYIHVYCKCGTNVYTEKEGKNNRMGDMAKKTTKSLEEKAAERAARKKSTDNVTIDNLMKKPNGKDKAISARVNGTTYMNFKKICEARGITSNACLNMLITDFVRENKNIIEQ